MKKRFLVTVLQMAREPNDLNKPKITETAKSKRQLQIKMAGTSLQIFFLIKHALFW